MSTQNPVTIGERPGEHVFRPNVPRPCRASVGRVWLTVAVLALTALPRNVAGTVTLPQTGQDTCYDASGALVPCAGTGHDGDVRAGVPWPSPRFVDNGDGTVSDRLTGLMWLRHGDCFGGRLDWPTALAAVKNLNASPSSYTCSGYTATYGDWRMPNANEMQSLVHFGQSNVSTWLNAQGFQGLQASIYYLTSTTQTYYYESAYASPNKYVFAVQLSSGIVNTVYKTFKGYLLPMRGQSSGPAKLWATGQQGCWDAQGTAVACAGSGQDGESRAGEPWPQPRFTDNGDGTVTDGLTGLMWLKDANCPRALGRSADGKLTWQNALNFVRDVNNGTLSLAVCGYGGSYGDWHLPNPLELRSLHNANERYSAAWLNSQGFRNVIGYTTLMEFNYYWTSATPPGLKSEGYCVGIEEGQFGWISASQAQQGGLLDNYLKWNQFLVWPVRATRVVLPEVDLSLVKEAAPDPVTAGATLTYTLSVANAGPQDDPAVTVVDTLPTGAALVSATASQGTCTANAGTVTCALGALASGASATATIAVTPSLPGSLVNTASVSGYGSDADPADNTATATTTVLPAPLAVTVSATPSSGPAPLSAALSATVSGGTAPFSYDWDFADGTPHATTPSTTHTYELPGSYVASCSVQDAASAVTQGSTTVVVTAPPAAHSYLVPSVAHAPGAAGTQWRTDVAGVNVSGSPAHITFTFSTTTQTWSRTATLPAGATEEWSDILIGLFDLSPAYSTKGTLVIGSNVPLSVSSRTYNQAAAGTFGQYYPALQASDALPAGATGIVPQLKKGSAFRTNLGLVNLGSSQATVTVRLLSGSGAQAGSAKVVAVPAASWMQVDDIFTNVGAGDQQIAYATVEVGTEGALVWAYASVVDSATGDPTTIPVLARTPLSASRATSRTLAPLRGNAGARPDGDQSARAGNSVVTIFTDGFEGPFPGEWSLNSATTTGWGLSTHRTAEGTRSVWCAGGGEAPGTPGGSYRSRMNTWLEYGPFSLADAVAARAAFKLWLDSEPGIDTFWYAASLNGTDYIGIPLAGTSGGWVDLTFDFAQASDLGALGKSAVWFAFVFQSDTAVQYEGAYVDDVRIEKTVAGAVCTVECQATVPLSAQVGETLTFQGTATATDCTVGPSFDWDFGDGAAHSQQQSPQHSFAAAGTFTWTFAASADGHSCTRTGTIAVAQPCAAPAITAQPQDATVRPGESAALSVTATGSEPLSYQWYRGTAGDTSDPVAGAATASLSTGPLSETASFWVRVANPCGAADSRSATVTVRSTFPYTIPSVAHAPGSGGTQWRTDVAAVNPADASTQITLTFTDYNASQTRTATASLPGHATVEWRDLLVGTFGLAAGSSNKGTLLVESEQPLFLSSRTYNQATAGTFGQYYPALTEANAISAGKTGVIPQLKKNSSFRTNVGLVNLGNSQVTVAITLHGASGAAVGSVKTMAVPAGRWMQQDDIFANVGAGTHDVAYAALEVQTAGGLVWAYASVVDNATGDPTTIPVLVQ